MPISYGQKVPIVRGYFSSNFSCTRRRIELYLHLFISQESSASRTIFKINVANITGVKSHVGRSGHVSCLIFENAYNPLDQGHMTHVLLSIMHTLAHYSALRSRAS